MERVWLGKVTMWQLPLPASLARLILMQVVMYEFVDLIFSVIAGELLKLNMIFISSAYTLTHSLTHTYISYDIAAYLDVGVLWSVAVE